MKVLGNVIKSASDKRTYKAIRLANELECLIVSDEEAQKSSAALSVGVGSLMDPVEAQGLAHYLEHMLFMGTEKFPEENDYMNVNIEFKHSSSLRIRALLTHTHLNNKPTFTSKSQVVPSSTLWTDSHSFSFVP